MESDLHRLTLSLEELVKIKNVELTLLKAEHNYEYHANSKCSSDGEDIDDEDEESCELRK